jgi:hypothetical protein
MTAALKLVHSQSLTIRQIPEHFRDLVEDFVEKAEEQGAASVVTCEDTEDICGVYLLDGTDIPCLAVAEGPDGSFACIDTTGKLLHFTEDELS